MEALDREMREMSAEPISTRLDHRRQRLESQMREYESNSLDLMHSEAPQPLMRARRRATRPSERLQRHRDRLNQTPTIRNEEDSLRMAEHTIPSVPRIGTPDTSTQAYSGEPQVNHETRWRAKRRKLDSDDAQEGFRGFRYGHRGQVVPGPLKMEILSCDGGNYDGANGRTAWPSNVLLDDNSVYCTKNDRCNMIFRHVGSMPFSLSKLVIKAPTVGYDAPIQEGMVFIAMSDDDLLSRTAQYRIRYSPKRYRRPGCPARAEQSQIRLGPSHEYYNSVRSPLRPIDRSTYLEDPYSGADAVWRPPNSSITAMTADFMERSTSHAATNTDQQVPGFRVTTNFDELSDGEEEARILTGQYTLEPSSETTDADLQRLTAFRDHYAPPPYRREHTSGDDESDDSQGSSVDDENLSELLRDQDVDYNSLPAREQVQAMDWARARRSWHERPDYRRATPAHVEVTSPVPDGALPTNGNGAAESGVLLPHARFFIRRDKSCVSIRFDPPTYAFPFCFSPGCLDAKA